MLRGIVADRVVHADWGSDTAKRWMCVADRDASSYRVAMPQPVGELSTLLDRVTQGCRDGCTLLGFDFPIGLPLAYARRAGISDFVTLLPALGTGDWRDFYDVAVTPEQVSLRRPFYPYRAGGTRQRDLWRGLGVASMHDLLRRCERPTPFRGAASSLFWTLGAKQVGRAAIVGWRDVLAPALRTSRERLRVWPFDGDLSTMARPGAVVVLETYPAEACAHIGLAPPGRGWSKRAQGGRQAQARALLGHARRRGHILAGDLSSRIRQGFGPRADGEDAFDAVVGLFSMLDVVCAARETGAPGDADVRRVEGWILGLDAGSPGRQEPA